MKKIAPLLGLSLLLMSLAFGQYTRQDVFVDDFSDNNSTNWSTEDTYGQTDLYLSGGKYYLDHKRSRGSWSSHRNINLGQNDDFEIVAKIKKISGIQDNGFGLIWGRVDGDNQHMFEISPNGYYRIKTEENNKYNKLTDWKLSSSIRQGNGQTNELKIKRIGGKVKYYVNGSFLVEHDFPSFFGSRFGFVIFQYTF